MTELDSGDATQTRLIAPWPMADVTLMNLFQVGVSSAGTGLVRICPRRGTRAHGAEGGEQGILVATVSGWVCPDCRYTRDWEDAAWVERACGRSGLQAPRRVSLHAVRARLASYSERDGEGGPAVTGMIESLRAREDSLARADQAWRPRGLNALLLGGADDDQALEGTLADLLHRTQASLSAWHGRNGERRPGETSAVSAFNTAIETFAAHLRERGERRGEPE